MEMIPVESSLLSHIGFDPDNNEFLAQFKSGTLGAYSPTTEAEFLAVVGDEESVGKAFNRIIKPVKKYRKVDGTAPKPMEVAQTKVAEDVSAIEIDSADTLVQLRVPALPPELQSQVNEIATRSAGLVIATPAANTAGQELIIAIGKTRKEVSAFFKPMKQAADKAHEAICEREKNGLAPLVAAQAQLSAAIIAFERQQEADRRAEQERLRIEAQARENEAARQESERLALEDALALEEAGDTAAAEAVLANPVPIAPRYVAAPIIPTTVARVSGAVVKTTWKAEVTNAALIPREWLLVDQAALDKFANNRKSLAVVPGVRFVESLAIHGRSGR